MLLWEVATGEMPRRGKIRDLVYDPHAMHVALQFCMLYVLQVFNIPNSKSIKQLATCVMRLSMRGSFL